MSGPAGVFAEQLQLALLNRRLSQMPAETQQQIKSLSMEIAGLIGAAGPEVGPAALALVSVSLNIAAARAKAG